MLSSYKVGTAADAVPFLSEQQYQTLQKEIGFLSDSLSLCKPFLLVFANLGNGLQTDPDNPVSSNVDQNNDNVVQYFFN